MRTWATVSAVTGRATPFSVTSAHTSSAGVTSNAGLRHGVPSTVSSAPPAVRTSSAERSSISIPSPSASPRSTDEDGPATTNGIPAAWAASARP